MLVGIFVVVSLINFVVLILVMFLVNSGIFFISCMLYGLVEEGYVLCGLLKLLCVVVLVCGLLFLCLCLLGGMLLIYLIFNLVIVFILVMMLVMVLFIFVWLLILVVYMVYCCCYLECYVVLIFKMFGGVVMCWVCLMFFVVVLVLLSL